MAPRVDGQIHAAASKWSPAIGPVSQPDSGHCTVSTPTHSLRPLSAHKTTLGKCAAAIVRQSIYTSTFCALLGETSLRQACHRFSSTLRRRSQRKTRTRRPLYPSRRQDQFQLSSEARAEHRGTHNEPKGQRPGIGKLCIYSRMVACDHEISTNEKNITHGNPQSTVRLQTGCHACYGGLSRSSTRSLARPPTHSHSRRPLQLPLIAIPTVLTRCPLPGALLPGALLHEALLPGLCCCRCLGPAAGGELLRQVH